MAENGSPGGLSTKQHLAIAALLAHPTVGAAAIAAGCGNRTLRRWLVDPDFRRELVAAELDLIDSAVRLMVSDIEANAKVMRTIRDDPTNGPAVRLRAAVAIADDLLRWRELRNVEARLGALEVAYDGSSGEY